MFVFIGGVVYSLDPPNAYLWGDPDPPDPPGNRRACPRGRPWPRGQILKSLALASKVKSLASRPQVLENWPVLGSRTAVFFELLKFCEALEKYFGKRFFVETARKIFVKTFFFFFLRSPKKFL